MSVQTSTRRLWRVSPAKPLTAAIAASLMTAGLVGGIAAASIPDGNGVIHGCYSKSGALKVIDSAVKSCPAGTTELDWNQTGVQGPAGPPGPTAPGSAQYEAQNAWALEINNGVTQAPLNIPATERLTITNYVWNAWQPGNDCRVFGMLGDSAVSYTAQPTVLDGSTDYENLPPVTGVDWSVDSSNGAVVTCNGNGGDLTLAGYLTQLTS
jgi:hypothetical protein